MSAWRTAGVVLAWGVAALWTTRTAAWLHGMQRLPDLLHQPPGAPRSRLSVIVPARNEGANVAAGLRSLGRSQDIDLEVIAVDDRSTDETGATMDALLTELNGSPNDGPDADSNASRVRYRVEHVNSLPPGWLGKPHAMARGVERATGEWLLFTDADVLFAPDALARALTYAERTGADHLVLMLTVIAGSAGEAMMLPFLHAISIWGPRLWRVQDAGSPRDCVGVGGFNLVRRSAYEAVGGWSAMRMEVVEDLRMGCVLKRAGFLSHVVTGRDLVRIRWAPGPWGVVANLTKNIFSIFRFRLPRMVAGTVGAAAICLVPFAAIGLGVTGARACLWPGLLSLSCLFSLYWRYHRAAGQGSPMQVVWVFAFPLATLLFLYTMAASTLLTLLRGGVVWRGTFYPLQELRANAGQLL